MVNFKTNTWEWFTKNILINYRHYIRWEQFSETKRYFVLIIESFKTFLRCVEMSRYIIQHGIWQLMIVRFSSRSKKLQHQSHWKNRSCKKRALIPIEWPTNLHENLTNRQWVLLLMTEKQKRNKKNKAHLQKNMNHSFDYVGKNAVGVCCLLSRMVKRMQVHCTAVTFARSGRYRIQRWFYSCHCRPQMNKPYDNKTMERCGVRLTTVNPFELRQRVMYARVNAMLN